MTEEELTANMADPMWRLSNLYKIIIKGDNDEDNLVIQFKPNRAQRRFIAALWHRNIILKARQLGFTTLICILWLDFALFNDNVRCGIIAQDREAAEIIFRDKVKFAYENLPAVLREQFPLSTDNASELRFAHNNSSIRVATSMRSGTIHRLHISEFGKICAKYPDKAIEVVTGSIPAVPKNGVLVVESTAEGREGEFYDMTQRAKAMHASGKALSVRDYRFHFFPWWQEPGYVMEPDSVVFTDKDQEYFAHIEGLIGKKLEPEQWAWYVSTRNADYSSMPERMWQEYPSTPDEAFQQSTEGCYYTLQFAMARKDKRICRVPYAPGTPVNTFWDIGQNDETSIWFHQRIGIENRFIKFYEAAGESFSHFVTMMQGTGYVWGRHYLPHDAAHKRQLGEKNKSAQEMLEDLGLTNTVIVPRIASLDELVGIQQVRDAFPSCFFDEGSCSEGLTHLELYRKEWDTRLACWRDKPRHDRHSNAADAFRQFAQAIEDFNIRSAKPKRGRSRNWRTA